MDPQHKKLLRTVIKQVHPDVLSKYPLEQLKNSEALKVLNDYIDRLSRGQPLFQHNVQFCTANGGEIRTVEVVLPVSGNLGPLFHAFGLMSEDEASSHHTAPPGVVDLDFLAWLAGIVSQASQSAAAHLALRSIADTLTADIQRQFNLLNIIATGQTSLSQAGQQQHIVALEVLQQCLREVCQDQPDMLAGLCIFLHHPSSNHWMGADGSRVEDNGNLTLVANPNTLRHDILQLDLDRAHHCTQLTASMKKQVSDMEATLTDLLGLPNVWFWTSRHRERFVHWASTVINCRSMYQEVRQEGYVFNMMVHCDEAERMVTYDDVLGLIQVSIECSSEQLLEYLQGADAAAASAAAGAVHQAKQEKERLLEAASDALGTQYVMRFISRHQQPDIRSSLERLISHAAAVRQTFDLSGVRVAIDECYEVSDSGLISIPWNFSTQDLQPQLLKLLGPQSAQLRAPPGSQAAEAVLKCKKGKTAQKRCSLTLGHVASQNLLTPFLGNHARLLGVGRAQSHMQNRQYTGCHQGQHTACYQRRHTACYHTCMRTDCTRVRQFRVRQSWCMPHCGQSRARSTACLLRVLFVSTLAHS